MVSVPQQISKKTFLVVGLLLLILSLIGLVLCFSTPWYSWEHEGDIETYYYGDFGENFEEDTYDEMDDYFHGSANLSLIGFLLIIFLSIILIIEGVTSVFSNFFSIHFFRQHPNSETNVSKSIFMLFIVLLMLIPICLSIMGGTRFIGFTSALQASEDSIVYEGEDFLETEDNYGTTAGYSAAILGFIIFLICFYLIFKILSNITSSNDSDFNSGDYTRKIGKFALLFILLSVIGLVIVPVFSFMNLEYERTWQVNPAYSEELDGPTRTSFKVTSFNNDGMIHLLAKMGKGDKVDDSIEDIEGDISLIAWSFVLILVVSIMTVFGIIFYRVGKFPKLSHIFITLGCLTLIFAIIILISYGLIAGVMGELNEEFAQITKESSEYMSSDFGKITIEQNAFMGQNYVPLVFGIILLITMLYLRLAFPFSVMISLGKITPEVEGTPSTTTSASLDPELGPTPRPDLGASYKYKRAPGKPIPRKVIAAIFIIVILVVAGAAGAFILMSGGEKKKKEENVLSEPENFATVFEPIVEIGYTEENQNSEVSFSVEEPRVTWINCSLYWNDEPSQYPAGTNNPDQFGISVFNSNGDLVAEDGFSDSGMVDCSVEIDCEDENYEDDCLGTWTVVVSAGDCGDDEARFSIGGLRSVEDTGNEWMLNCLISYLTPADEIENVEETDG